MVKIENLYASKIKAIFLVYLEDILLEMIFFLESSNDLVEVTIEISNDAETILYKSRSVSHIEVTRGEIYSVVNVKHGSSDLVRFIGQEVIDFSFGVGDALDPKREVLYYFKITTKLEELLFFNNGDDGAYSIDNIIETLKYDIYGYKWLKHPESQ